MRKKLFLWLILMIISAIFVCADYNMTEYTTLPAYASSAVSNLQIKSLRYEPYPVNPGEYVKLWIKVENLGTGHTSDATFRLIPEFPFSLDSEEDAVKRYGQIGYGRQKGDNVIVLEYKLKVDKDAIKGTNEIELKYNIDNSDSWFSKTFEMDVADAQTDFDLVIQEVEEQTVAIAIANTGKNVAYSVIVKLPEQQNFDTVGTSGQMVGNLEDGDYSMVSFEIKEKARTTGKKTLLVQIDYTDNIGERRTVIKEVIYESGGASVPAVSELTEEQREEMREQMMARGGRFGPMQQQQQKEIYQEWWFWAIIIVVLYAGWRGFKFVKARKSKKK
ncbi:hypothetical protein JW851_00830 [Candidatus Woesearchaeota archaeon]|nr:hypothetical protein [Candidatus Woesearchaeota archaeon]